jgi:hypothetical protein
MCEAIHYESKSCKHCWLALQVPCAPGSNLLTCPMFTKGALTYTATIPPHSIKWAPSHSCPWCDCKGAYDMAYVRMITKQKNGIRYGIGPARYHQPGVESYCCCVVMWSTHPVHERFLRTTQKLLHTAWNYTKTALPVRISQDSRGSLWINNFNEA